MTEAEAPWRVGWTDQVALEQFVECYERIFLGDSGRLRGEIWLERLADRGGALQQGPSRYRERVDFGSDRGADCGWHSGAGGVVVLRSHNCAALARGGELLEIERIAAALAVEDLAQSRLDCAAQQLLCFDD